MTRLCTINLKLDPRIVDLLFGSFASWHAATNVERGVSRSIHTEAIALLRGQPPPHTQADDVDSDVNETYYRCTSERDIADPKQSVKYCAALRVVIIWRLYLKHRGSVPIEAMFPYYCGILMDLHMKLLHFDPGPDRPPLQLHEVYLLDLAPEQVGHGDIYCNEDLCMSEAVVEFIWAQYIRDCAAGKPFGGVKSTRKKKSKRGTKKATKTPKRSTNDTPFTIPLMCPYKITAAVPFTVRQNPDMHRQIAFKGVLRTTSIRYIRISLHKALVAHPEDNEAVVNMVKLFFLGAYKHCAVIAPPHHRSRVYSGAPIKLLYDRLAKLNPKELYSMIAEHIISAAKKASGLYEILRQDPDWTAYSSQTLGSCDLYLRASFYATSIGIVPLKRAPRSQVSPHKYPPTPSAVFWTLAKVLGPIKTKISASVNASAIAALSCTLNEFYQTVRKQSSNCEIIAGVLLDVGVPQSDVDVILAHSVAFNRDKLSKCISNMLKAIRQGTRDILYIYVHFLIQRSYFAVLPIQHDIDDIVVASKEFPTVKACVNCYTIRSQSRSVTGVCRKSKEGMHIDTVNPAVMCSTCKSDNIVSISLRTNRVMGVSMNAPAVPQIITRCHACSTPTVYKHTIGVTDLCQKCFTKAHREFEARVCVCGAEFSAKRPAECRLVARNENGDLSMYALCKPHAGLATHAASPFLPVGFYRALLPKRQLYHV
jgi:hypothetical protein